MGNSSPIFRNRNIRFSGSNTTCLCMGIGSPIYFILDNYITLSITCIRCLSGNLDTLVFYSSVLD